MPLTVFERSFSRGASLPLTQAVVESSAALAHASSGGDPSRRGNERRVRKETFLYLIAVKEPVVDFRDALSDWLRRDGMWESHPFGRVLSTPRKRPGHVLVDVLAPNGQMGVHTVTQKKLWPSDYRYVRKLAAGSTVPMVLLNEPSTRWDHADVDAEEYYEEYDYDEIEE